jgi:hypothetical protein
VDESGNVFQFPAFCIVMHRRRIEAAESLGGNHMRKMPKIALGLAILLAATAPGLAAKGKSKSAMAKPAATEPANPNEAGFRLMRDAIPIFLPAYTLPIYLKMKENKAAKSGAAKKSRKK